MLIREKLDCWVLDAVMVIGVKVVVCAVRLSEGSLNDYGLEDSRTKLESKSLEVEEWIYGNEGKVTTGEEIRD